MDKNNRILIVDDDPRIRAAYREILSPAHNTDVLPKGAALFKASTREMKPSTRRKYDLIIAERGEEAVKAVAKTVEQQSPFAAAFIDMKMPGINGAETSKRIWSVDPDIKIVIVTAYSEYTPDNIIRVVGRDDIIYLRKPFCPEVIRQLARFFTTQWNLEIERKSLLSDSGRPGGYHSDKESKLFNAEADRLVGLVKPSAVETDECDKLRSAEHGYFAGDHLDGLTSITTCPFCDYGMGYRIRRNRWMRFIFGSKYYQCNRCYGKFLKVANLETLFSKLF